jgi:alcohol dehydrogenase class IV
MNLTTFSFPTPTLFGAGALKELPPRLHTLKIQRPLVVTDAGLLATDAFRRLVQALGADAPDQRWFLYPGVHPNPIEADVREAAAAFRQNNCDGVIAIGGGSPLDVGKAARLLAKRPGFDLAKFYDEPDWSGLAPFVAIPTTAGTGSEVGRSSVITLDATQRKSVLFHPELLAKLVILDPELTVGLPPKLTAATGADALTHCIESYTCPVFHPMCDGIALEGVRLIVDALPRAYKNGKDLDARGKMLVASAMGALLSKKISAWFIRWRIRSRPFVECTMAWQCALSRGRNEVLRGAQAGSLPTCWHRLRPRGDEMLRRRSGSTTIAFVSEFLAGLGLNTKLREHGVKSEHLDALVAQAVEDPCHKTNAVPVTHEDFRALYLQVT